VRIGRINSNGDRPFEDDGKDPLEWTRHDRTHLEVSVDYPGDPALPTKEHEWEAYYFLPASFRIDAMTFPKADLYASFQSYVRFSVPMLSMADFSGAAGELGDLLAEAPASQIDRELKLFACRAREAIAREARRLLSDLEASVDPEMASRTLSMFADEGRDCLLLSRKAFNRVRNPDANMASTIRWVDEHLSRRLESSLVKLADQLEQQHPGSAPRAVVAEAAIEEARYRKERGLGPISSTDGSTREMEDIELHQHALKRLTSSVLWLDIEIEDAHRWALHVFHAVAAGVAMAFAVLAALAVGNPVTSGRLWVWGLGMVVAYMLKDRIKAVLQDVFTREIGSRLPDRRWTVRDPQENNVLASVTEAARFISPDEVAGGARELRARAYRDTLQELTRPELVLRHRKTMRLHLDAVQSVDSRFTSLTEVFRLDVERWLRHTDDTKRSVTLADPDRGELFAAKLPRAYDVVVVYRVTDRPEDDGDWHSVQVVVSRTGIRRVGRSDWGAPA
jgi:hypothetical protein